MTNNENNGKTKDVNIACRAPKPLKDAFYSKYDNPSEKLRELIEMAVSDDYTGRKEVEELKKKVKELRNKKERVLEEKESKLDEIESRINLFEEKIEEAAKNKETAKEKKKKILMNTYEQLCDGGEGVHPVKEKAMKYDIEEAQHDGVKIQDREEWKKLLAEMYQEDYGERPEYIPVQYEDDIGQKKQKRLEVGN